jgi:hypothetical protein
VFAARGGFGGSAEDSWQQDLDTEHRERIQEKEKKKVEDIWAGQFPSYSSSSSVKLCKNYFSGRATILALTNLESNNLSP